MNMNRAGVLILSASGLACWAEDPSAIASDPRAENVTNAPESAEQANEKPFEASGARPVAPRHPLFEFKFTNQLGQPVSLSDFEGRGLAITFIFTRCPVPDYCPRLTQNFQEAMEKIRSMPDAPANWHFLSVTIDPDSDTPGVLEAYGKRYRYDPERWSFLTGPKERVAKLARLSDVTYEEEGAFYNHNFRNLIIDPSGRLRMSFPTGGNLSEPIAAELIKAAAQVKP